MAITHYSSLDTGAPALPSVSGQRFIDNLKLIFKACLVDGYGAKPAAGWTVGHEHADGFSLSNGEGFINFVSVSNQTVAVYLMESITDTSTALAGGYNRRSGPWFDGESTTARQYLYAPAFYATVANKQWFVVADDKTVVFEFCGNSTAVDASSQHAGAVYFGAYTSSLGIRGFCALGGGASTTSTPSLLSPTNTRGTVLRNPFTGSVDQGAAPGYTTKPPGESANSGSVVRIKPLTSIALRPVRLAMSGSGIGISGSTNTIFSVNCGLLRGLVGDPYLTDNYLTPVLQALGIASPVYADRLKAITLPNGNQWVPLYPFAGDAGAFVSLDPADWS